MQPSAARPYRTSPSPVPPRTPAEAVRFDEANDEIRRLAADIDGILARPPGPLSRRLSSVRLVPPGPAPVSDALDVSADSFADLPSLLKAADGSAIGGSDRAAGWLRKAKRERRFSRLRAASSWLIALGVGSGIVAASAVVILGRMPSLSEMSALVRAALS